MALFVTAKVDKELVETIPSDASRFYIHIPKAYLYEAYDLITGDRVRGEILKISDVDFDASDFKGKPIELIFKTGMVYDKLFISMKDWKENFREYGLVEGGYEIELKLGEAITYTGKTIKLYSKRDVKIKLT